MMKTALALALLLACAAALKGHDGANQWAAFKAKYGKQYASKAEDARRMAIYYKNLAEADKLNDPSDPEAAVHGETQFSDLTPEEFNALWKGYNPNVEFDGTDGDSYSGGSSGGESSGSQGSGSGNNGPLCTGSNATLPTAFDWRYNYTAMGKPKCVSAVKNQAQCGSCWAFSATEGLESAWAFAGKGLTKLSEQQTVSCDTVDLGCDGGNLNSAWHYMMQAGGVESEADYPYTSQNGANGRCKFDKSEVVADLTGFCWTTESNSEPMMQKAMYQNGPISICVSTGGWQSYQGGIMKNGCGEQVDHCVQTTGWGVSNDGTPFWYVRNSWAESWGEDGYIRIVRGQNECLIAGNAGQVIVSGSDEE